MATPVVFDLGYIRGNDGYGVPGEPGAPGRNGSTILHGAGAPPDELGDDSDYYIDQSSGYMYQKNEGSWGEPVATFASFVDQELDEESTNPVENRAIKEALDGKVDADAISPTPTEDGNDPFSTGGAYLFQQRISNLDQVKTRDDAIVVYRNGNTVFSGTKAARRYGNIVFLTFLPNNNSTWKKTLVAADNRQFAQIQAGYRPLFRQSCFGRIRISGESSTRYCVMWIETDGAIRPANMAFGPVGEKNGWKSLDGVTIEYAEFCCSFEAP